MSSGASDGCTCPTCGETFSGKRGRAVHHKQAHGESIAERPADQRGAQEGAKHECPTCGDAFTTEVGMKTHHAQQHSDDLRPEHECENCGETFRAKPYRNPTYCSYSCKNSDQLSGEDNPNWAEYEAVTCERCGDDFNVKPSIADRTRFCSMECRRNQVTIECAHCGDGYSIKACAADGSRFCSRDCKHEWMKYGKAGSNNPRWKGGAFPYGEGWSVEKRRKVRIRDQARCQHCGRTEPEHIEEYGGKHVVHHITPAREIDDAEDRNAMDNLVTLCRGECHRTWEQMAPLRPANPS